MIGTLFRVWKYSRNIKKGTANPANFAFEQLAEMALVPLIIPGIILVLILVGLGILGFSDWVFADGSKIVRIFFWIICIFTVITTLGIVMTYRGIRKLWKKGTHAMGVEGKNLHDITYLQK